MARSNIGKDTTITILYNGVRVDLPDITMFDSKPEYKVQRTDPLNGPPRETPIPSGWRISISCDRDGPALDALFNSIETAFWTTGATGTGSIYQIIKEVDGTTTTYEFQGVGLKLDDPGSWSAETTVKQKISGFASVRTTL